MAKRPSKIVYAFIDSQNLNLSIQDQGWKLDFGRFHRYLQDKYQVSKAFLFIGYMSQNESMYTNLQKQGFILVFKPTLKMPDGTVKGNVDADLVLNAMIEYPHYDQAVLISNDGDFYCLVEYLNANKKLARLLVPNRRKYSSLLKKFMPKIHFLSQLRSRLEYKKERH
jgi:uncharacterized LabA/DUF88 family protein